MLAIGELYCKNSTVFGISKVEDVWEVNQMRDWLARQLLRLAQQQYAAGKRKELNAGRTQKAIHAAEIALWDLLRRPGHTKPREGMTHNEFVDYLHARFQWASFYGLLLIGAWCALIVPTSPDSTIRNIGALLLAVPTSLIFLTWFLLFQQCGWFENVKHPEVIPVGTRCPLCSRLLETGDRITPSYLGEEEFFRHLDCDDPKGINIEWLQLSPPWKRDKK